MGTHAEGVVEGLFLGIGAIKGDAEDMGGKAVHVFSPGFALDEPDVAAAEASAGGDAAVLADMGAKVSLDGGEDVLRVGCGVLEADKDAAVLEVGLKGEREKVVGVDGAEEVAEGVEDILLAEEAVVVADTGGRVRGGMGRKQSTYSQVPRRTGKTESTKSQASRV